MVLFWPFRRQTRRPSPPSRLRARPSVEVLEGRDVPSVTVAPFTLPSGVVGLRVIESGRNDTVTITDNSTAGTTTVVADGRTQTFARQFTLFDLELVGSKDAFTFDLAGAYSARLADIQVLLGKGENHSTLNVNMPDSGTRQDVDTLTLFAKREADTGSPLNCNTQLGAGNKSFKATIDANQFQIDDDGGVFSPGPTPGTFAPHSGGAAHFNVLAGSGNDTISFQSINQAHTIELSVLFDINILGCSATDNFNVNLDGPGGF